MAMILEGSQSPCLREGIYVERLANLLKFGDQFGVADAIPDAQACESVYF